MIVFRITFDLYLHWPNHSAPRGVRKRQVEGARPSRRAAIFEECLRAHGETVTLAVPLMPLASYMLPDTV